MNPPISLSLARLFGALFLAAASSACSGVNNAGSAPAAVPLAAAAPAATPAAAPAAGKLMEQINAEIGAASCDATAQCKTLAVGAKACGGPEGYLAYSTKISNGARLAELAARDAQARKKADARAGMVSTCSIVSDPGAICEAGRCVIQQRNGGSSNLR